LAVVVAGSACSGSASKKAKGTPSTAGGTTETLRLKNPSAPPVVVKVSKDAVASVPSSTSGLQFEVFLLKRTGSTVTLVGALHNTANSAVSVDDQLGDGRAIYDVSGVSIVDGVNLKQYQTLRGSDLSAPGPGCLCASTAEVSFPGVQPGARWFFAALFQVPPPDINTVAVYSPIGVIPSVPITK
jgi:hypothetical protein